MPVSPELGPWMMTLVDFVPFDCPAQALIVEAILDIGQPSPIQTNFARTLHPPAFVTVINELPLCPQLEQCYRLKRLIPVPDCNFLPTSRDRYEVHPNPDAKFMSSEKTDGSQRSLTSRSPMIPFSLKSSSLCFSLSVTLRLSFPFHACFACSQEARGRLIRPANRAGAAVLIRTSPPCDMCLLRWTPRTPTPAIGTNVLRS